MNTGQLALLTVFLDMEEDLPDSGKRKRSTWVKPIFKRREEKGHFKNLLQELALDDCENYRRYLRMDTSTFYEIVDAVKPEIQKKDTAMRAAISAEERVALTLRYLATGDSYASQGFNFRISVPAISSIVPEVCNAIWKTMQEKYLRVPRNEEEWKAVGKQFELLWNFPRCIGAVDGKHVAIRKPGNSGSHHFNYKGYFSFVLMAVADADCRFIYVDVGTNGRVSDGGVWGKCSFKDSIEKESLNLPKDENDLHYVFVGDEAFPLKHYLMRPYPGRTLNDRQRIFNYRLSRARRVVENAFGILTAVWRVYKSPMQISLDNAISVVKATCVLHNMLRSKRSTRTIYSPPDLLDSEDCVSGIMRPGSWRSQAQSSMTDLGKLSSNAYSKHSGTIRDNLCEYFNGPGAVPWQNQLAFVKST